MCKEEGERANKPKEVIKNINVLKMNFQSDEVESDDDRCEVGAKEKIGPCLCVLEWVWDVCCRAR